MYLELEKPHHWRSYLYRLVRLHYSFYSDSTHFEIIVHTIKSKMAQDWFEKFENNGSMFKYQKYFVCAFVEFWMEGNFWSIAIGPYCEKMHQFLFLNHISRKVAWFLNHIYYLFFNLMNGLNIELLKESKSWGSFRSNS